MMKQLRLSLLLIMYFSFFISCSTNISEKEFDTLNIKIVDVQSWLNLMPGGPGSFHITGKYELPENLNEKEIFLDKIIILDNEKEIYSLTAELQFVNNSTTGIKEFTFTNHYQTKIDPILMQKDSIDIQIVFSINGTSIPKEINKIPLTRAY